MKSAWGMLWTVVILIGLLGFVLSLAEIQRYPSPPMPASVQEWVRYQDLTNKHREELAAAFLWYFEQAGSEVELFSLTVISYTPSLAVVRVKYRCKPNPALPDVVGRYEGDITFQRGVEGWQVRREDYWVVDYGDL